MSSHSMSGWTPDAEATEEQVVELATCMRNNRFANSLDSDADNKSVWSPAVFISLNPADQLLIFMAQLLDRHEAHLTWTDYQEVLAPALEALQPAQIDNTLDAIHRVFQSLEILE